MVYGLRGDYQSWNEAVFIPLHKKGDKMKCDNYYRGISLLNSAYKPFAGILLKRLTPYVKEHMGKYHLSGVSGKENQRIDQLSIIGQIIEKRYGIGKICGDSRTTVYTGTAFTVKRLILICP